ncbi:MAG: terminase small subunit [Candidatus Hydrogenedentes bacterium]|nr:terminase small subunit [Candidatus Hydrogenedentota bacterium]
MPRLSTRLLDMAEVAVIEAGYGPRTARRTASRLLRRHDFPGVVLQRIHGLESTATKLELQLADIFLAEEERIGVVHHGDCSQEFARLNTVEARPRFVKQRYTRFVEGFFRFAGNQTKAAIYAGYSPRWAGTNTSRLMKHPAVQSELARIRSHLMSR